MTHKKLIGLLIGIILIGMGASSLPRLIEEQDTLPTQAILATAAPTMSIETIANTPIETVQVADFGSTVQGNSTEAPSTKSLEILEAQATTTIQPQIIGPTLATAQQVDESTAYVLDAAPVQPVPDIVVISFELGASDAERAAYIDQLNTQGLTIQENITAVNTLIVQLPAGATTATLPSSSLIAHSEPDYYITAQALPNDPLIEQQMSALNQWDVPQIWASLPGQSDPVLIAVIDSGINVDHPDLSGKIRAQHDFLENDEVAQDICGHGTEVAGIIAAVSDNAIGMAGIAQNAEILSLRVLDGACVGRYSDVAQAVIYATDAGAKIINLSLGGPNESQLLKAAIDYAIEHGVSVIAAAGNQAAQNPLWPASYEPVVAVGATDVDGSIATFSNLGYDVLAPGVSITTTNASGGYSVVSGTSFSAPYISGLVALGVDISVGVMPTPIQSPTAVSTVSTAQSDLVTALNQALPRVVMDEAQTAKVDENYIHIAGDWASGAIILVRNTGYDVPDLDGVDFVAHLEAGAWAVTLEDDTTFAALQEQLPEELQAPSVTQQSVSYNRQAAYNWANQGGSGIYGSAIGNYKDGWSRGVGCTGWAGCDVGRHCTTFVARALREGGLNVSWDLVGNHQLIEWMNANTGSWTRVYNASQLEMGDFILINWKRDGETNITTWADHSVLVIGNNQYAQWNSERWGLSITGDLIPYAYDYWMIHINTVSTPAPANTELVTNGDFQNGGANWTIGANTDSALYGSTLLAFKTHEGATYGSIQNNIGYTLPANAPIEVNLDLANASNVTKRVRVHVTPSDSWGSGSIICDINLWAYPGAPMQHYHLSTRTTGAWSGIRVYIEEWPDHGSGIPDVYIDNVSVMHRPSSSATSPTCRPGQPQILTPTSNQIITAQQFNVTFRPAGANGTGRYNHVVQVATDSAFTNILVDTNWQAEGVTSIPVTLPTTITSRPLFVRLYQGDVCCITSDPSSTLTIQYVRPVPAPVLNAPADNGTVTTSRPIFSWTAPSASGVTVTGYELQIDAGVGGSFNNSAIISVGGIVLTYTPPAALMQTSYQWRMRTVAGTDRSPWSQIRTVTISDQTAAPLGWYFTTASPTLAWTTVAGAVMYEITVDDTDPLTAPIIYTTTASQYTVGPLQDGHFTYKVRAKLSGNTWSAVTPSDSIEISVP